MKIAFVTTCKGRVQHIERTLPQNLADNADYPDCVFIVLDYNSPDHLLDHLSHGIYQPHIESGRLKVYSYGGDHPFRMGHAKNMVHRLGIMDGADILVNMDADNWAAPGFATWIAERFRAGAPFLWCNAKSVSGRARQGLAGRIALTKDLFLATGGYDERYSGWAPEDQDLKARLRRITGSDGERIDNHFLYVIPHKDGLRFKEYPDAKPTPESEAAALREIYESDRTVANWGNVGCGTVYRKYIHPDLARPKSAEIAEFTKGGEPRIWNGVLLEELEPLPTRVFGIGMHKTGTTSLHEAFKILGYDSAHWTGPWWAKKIWEEMQAGRSLTLEKHYAMSDLPFPLLYRQLDKAYPGSKFILTRRDESKWIESVKNHWDYNINPWRKTWDNDCFTHRLHNLTYGRKHFDAETMLNAYRRHNAEVGEYFKHRSNDLLVMDVDAPTWTGLCQFLGKPVPAVDYPRAFVTKKGSQVG